MNIYCGFIKNLFANSQVQINSTTIQYDLKANPVVCVNVSNCIIQIPYLCEVNCLNNQEKCQKWVQGNKEIIIEINFSFLK